jgi:hypothetical protein
MKIAIFALLGFATFTNGASIMSDNAGSDQGALCIMSGDYFCSDEDCETSESTTLSSCGQTLGADLYNADYVPADTVYWNYQEIDSSFIAADADSGEWPVYSYEIGAQWYMELDIQVYTYWYAVTDMWENAGFAWMDDNANAVGYCQTQYDHWTIDPTASVEVDDSTIDDIEDAVDDALDDLDDLIDDVLDGDDWTAEWVDIWYTSFDDWSVFVDTGNSSADITRSDDDCATCMQMGNYGWSKCVFLNPTDEVTTIGVGMAAGSAVKAASVAFVGLATFFSL